MGSALREVLRQTLRIIECMMNCVKNDSEILPLPFQFYLYFFHNLPSPPCKGINKVRESESGVGYLRLLKRGWQLLPGVSTVFLPGVMPCRVSMFVGTFFFFHVGEAFLQRHLHFWNPSVQQWGQFAEMYKFSFLINFLTVHSSSTAPEFGGWGSRSRESVLFAPLPPVRVTEGGVGYGISM